MTCACRRGSERTARQNSASSADSSGNAGVYPSAIRASIFASTTRRLKTETERLATTRRTQMSGRSYVPTRSQSRWAMRNASWARSSAPDRLPDNAYASPTTDRNSRS